MKKTDVAALSSKQKQKYLSYAVVQRSFASLPGQLLMRLTNQLWQKHRYTEDESDKQSLGCLGPWDYTAVWHSPHSLSGAGQTTRTLSHTPIPQSIGSFSLPGQTHPRNHQNLREFRLKACLPPLSKNPHSLQVTYLSRNCCRLPRAPGSPLGYQHQGAGSRHH